MSIRKVRADMMAEVLRLLDKLEADVEDRASYDEQWLQLLVAEKRIDHEHRELCLRQADGRLEEFDQLTEYRNGLLATEQERTRAVADCCFRIAAAVERAVPTCDEEEDADE